MKKYTEFVNKTYKTITELYEVNNNGMYAIFAEGSSEPLYSPNQEYAILRNEYAKVFVSIIQTHSELLEISDTEYQLKHSPTQIHLNNFIKKISHDMDEDISTPLNFIKNFQEEVKISHSCYPKNLRRWLTGTISRKKKCRLEFCVLVWCHAIGWNLSENNFQDEKLNRCQQKLKSICMDYLSQEDISNNDMSFEILWKASTYAYHFEHKINNSTLPTSKL